MSRTFLILIDIPHNIIYIILSSLEYMSLINHKSIISKKDKQRRFTKLYMKAECKQTKNRLNNNISNNNQSTDNK